MNITVEKTQSNLPVTILCTHGELDASNFQELISIARSVIQSGDKDLLIDLSDTSFISSAGLVALHTIASLLRGDPAADPDAGWEALHAIDRDRESGFQQHIKLLNPQPRVERALATTGLNQFFAIFKDRETALASFA